MDRETMIEEAKKAKAKRKMKVIAGGVLAVIVIAVGGFVGSTAPVSSGK